ncbi:MAG: GNAT family protein [Thermoleophilaceae bacterium]
MVESVGGDASWNLAMRLEGEVVVLEPLEASHGQGLHAAGQAEEIWTWWPLDPTESRATTRRWIDGCLAAAERGERQHYATLDAGTGAVIGSTSYCLIQPEHKVVEIGWTWLAPSYWGTGANVEAKLLMLRHAFDVLGCQRVQLVTDARNERSRAAIEALPAQFEGVHRDDRIVRDGVRRSSAYYSILDSEWPDVRRCLVNRLERSRLSGSSPPQA